MAVCYHARMIVYTPPDITGDSATHKLSDIPGLGISKCKWMQMIGITIAAHASRVGDVNTTATRGTLITAGGGQIWYPIAMQMDFYDLTQIYYTIATGDTAQFLAGV